MSTLKLGFDVSHRKCCTSITFTLSQSCPISMHEAVSYCAGGAIIVVCRDSCLWWLLFIAWYFRHVLLWLTVWCLDMHDQMSKHYRELKCSMLVLPLIPISALVLWQYQTKTRWPFAWIFWSKYFGDFQTSTYISVLRSKENRWILLLSTMWTFKQYCFNLWIAVFKPKARVC